MVTDDEVLTQRLDLEMIERPHLWPRGGIVYVKRLVNGKLATGPCRVGETPESRVIRQHEWGGIEDAATITVLTYADAAAVVSDGWRVD